MAPSFHPLRPVLPFVAVRWLKWQGESYVSYQRTSTSLTSEAEAAVALMTLAGFQCYRCGKPLREQKGWVCCGNGHCPFCGMVRCKHRMICVLSEAPRQFCEGQGFSVEETASWRNLLWPIPPARPLSGQETKGYPVWWPEQIQDAYALPVLKHLRTLFGANLRGLENADDFRLQIAHLLQTVCIKPNVVTMPDAHVELFYSADPDAARNRVECFLTDLADGTERLRAMRPDRIERTR